VSRQRALNFAPGAEFLYTNTGYSLAALVVERASGRPLAQFTEERLFRPLGMTRTRWRDDFRRVVPGRATRTARWATSRSGGPAAYREDMPFTNVVGNGGPAHHGGRLAALERVPRRAGRGCRRARWPGPHRSARDAWAARERPRAAVRARPRPRHGGRRPTVSHGGSTAGYKTWLGRVPARGVSVAVLCTTAVPTRPTSAARRGAVLAAPGGGTRAEPARGGCAGAACGRRGRGQRGTWLRYAGVFWSRGPVRCCAPPVVGDRLVLQRASVVVLTPDGPHRFRLPGARAGEYLEFVPAHGRPRELRVVDRGDTVRLAPVPPPDTAAGALAAYAGTYRSAELDVPVTVALRDGALVWRQPFGVERPLRAAFADGFTAPLRGTTTVVFTRDRSGRVTGLGMWAAAVRDLRFVRE
jgi:hypothetical protein